jgi:hypothetical protein
MGSRSLEEFGDGDTLAADEELAGRVVGFIEGGDAGERLFATAAFDFDGVEEVAALEHEIDFQVPLPPVGDGDSGADGGVDEMSADGGCDLAAPSIGTVARPRQSLAVRWTRPASPVPGIMERHRCCEPKILIPPEIFHFLGWVRFKGGPGVRIQCSAPLFLCPDADERVTEWFSKVSFQRTVQGGGGFGPDGRGGFHESSGDALGI